MSTLNSVLSEVGHLSGLDQEQQFNLVQTVMRMFGNRVGLIRLMNNSKSQGIGDIVESWISTGTNQQIAPQQVQGLLGEDNINQLAAHLGVPPALAGVALARVLPVVVDKLTPRGDLPQAA